MRRKRRFPSGARKYHRLSPRFERSGKTILIVTEGGKTEPNYFVELRNRFRLSATDIEVVHPDGTDPVTLTNKAIELREKRKNEAKSGILVEYDEVWVVFDLEKTHDIRREQAKRAKVLPGAKGVNFALSDPSFEYWLLLHCEYTTASFPDNDSVEQRLKNHWPDYTKGSRPSPDFLEKVPDAVKHALRCRKHHRDCDGDGNPSTQADRVVRSMNEATREHLQYILPAE